MSVKDSNLFIDVQDGTNGHNIDVIDFDDFSVDYFPDNLKIETTLTLGQYKLINSLIKVVGISKHDVFIKIGYRN